MSDTAAEIAAETGVTVLRVDLARWVDDPTEQPWELRVGQAAHELRQLTAPTGAAASVSGRPDWSQPD